MNSRERFERKGKLVRRAPNRPPVETKTVDGGLWVLRQNRLTVEATIPLTEFRVVRGKTIGGGVSAEAIRRARRRLANGSH